MVTSPLHVFPGFPGMHDAHQALAGFGYRGNEAVLVPNPTAVPVDVLWQWTGRMSLFDNGGHRVAEWRH